MTKMTLSALLAALSACEGSIGSSLSPAQGAPASPSTPSSPSNPTYPSTSLPPSDPSDPGSGGSGGGVGTTGPDPVVTSCGAPPPSRIWRLSHAQYNRSVAAVLSTTLTPGTAFELESSGSGFRGGADTSYVSSTLARQYFNAAEALAAEAVKTPAKLLPCTTANPADTACVQAFIAKFGRRLFRAPPSSARQTLYFTLYKNAATPILGVQMVLEAMLQSPYFLYRRELGAAAASGTAAPLTPSELASALSFLLWDAPPDDALLDKADQGLLATPSQLNAEVDRMLASPSAKGSMWRFVEQAFEFDRIANTHKDAALFPDFTPALKADLLSEGEAFVNHVTTAGTGTLRELLTANYSMLNQRLATHYGVSGVTGTTLVKTALPAGQRAGLLTHAGLLAVHGDERSGSPVQRGLFVRAHLLCQDVPAPPANVADTLDPPSAVKTTRDRYKAHLQNASCVSCHKLMDPIGFGLENFDSAGRHREKENGVVVDSSGEFLGTRDIDGTFVGAQALSTKVASSAQVSDCVATRYFRFAAGRLEGSADECSLASVRTAFQSSGTRLSSLVRALVLTPSFSMRTKP